MTAAHLDWILPDIAVGGIEAALDHDRLRDEGVRSILSVNDFPTLSLSEFRWRRIALKDGPGNPPERILEAVSALEELHRESPAVLVHCAEGKSRSVLIVTMYVARMRGIHLDEAFEFVKSSRKKAEVDHALWQLGLDLHHQHAAKGPLHPLH